LQTPRIDRLLSEGLRFDNFYANCPVCSPTRAALMTGRYPDLVGVPGVIRTHPENSWGFLSPRAVTLADILRSGGYHTAIVGKWHLGLDAPARPNDRGFDHFHGFLGDMMDDYFHHRRHEINYMRRDRDEISSEGHATELFTEWACTYLQSRREQSQPFFLYLAYNAPHTPIQPPEDWLRRVTERVPGLAPQRAQLAALIEHLDDGVGRVLDCLDENGLGDNTLVIFTSDNGGQLSVGARNGPLRDGKGTVYEGGIKVCAGFRWADGIEAGGRTSFRAMTMDLYPTICDVAGIQIPHRIDGRSLRPTLLGNPQEELREYWFWTRREGGEQFGGKTIDAVRRGDWKLLQNSPFGPLELYNLAEDPQEERNRAAEEQPIFRELAAVLRKQIQRSGEVPWQTPRGE
jgi:arylsulfatase A-like enzyme